VTNAGHHQIDLIVVGKGRRTLLAGWDDVNVGPDAVVVPEEGVLRRPLDEREQAAVKGALDLPGRRALGDDGDERGRVTDATFDTETGRVETVLVGETEVPGHALLGAGSYAAVLAAQFLGGGSEAGAR
jgi:sporulation protein YlmC with PRC-barrel domain